MTLSCGDLRGLLGGTADGDVDGFPSNRAPSLPPPKGDLSGAIAKLTIDR
jgi:hypothetical protein